MGRILWRDFKVGTYNWRLEGKKGIYDKIDWRIMTFGIETTEWTIWESSTEIVEAHGANIDTNWGDYTGKDGFIINISNANILLKSAKKVSASTATKVYLINYSNNATLAIATFSGDIAVFSSPPLMPAYNKFYLLADNNGASYNLIGTNSGPNYPRYGTYMNWIGGWVEGVSNPNQYVTISSINVSVEKFIYLEARLISPANNSQIASTSINFTTNYTYGGMDIKNGTYYVWFSNGSLFNKTTVDVSSSTNFSSIIINNFIISSYYWNVYACGTNSSTTFCTFGEDGNYTFDIGGAILNESYSNITQETTFETFQVNFSLFPDSNVFSVYLVYNDVPYVVSDIKNYGDSVELKRTIDIPLDSNPFANQTNQFYWSLVYSNIGFNYQNTSKRNQTVLPLNIVYCNNTFQQTALNFTTYDETNPNPKINSTFHTSWQFWSINGSGTIKKNYSFEDTSKSNSSFKFCIDPNQSIMKTDMDAEMTSTGFFPRTYYLRNATVNNVTQEVKLFMINDSLGVKFFHTIRRGVTRVSNAIVMINKYDVGKGEWITVGIRKTDDEGEFIEYLELDKTYNYAIIQNGVFLANIEKTSTCSATPCTINLDIPSGAVNVWEGYYDFFAENVVYNLSYDKTTHNVTYEFIDTSGLANYFRLQVNKISANETGELICNKTLFSTVGKLTCNLEGYTGQFVAKTYVSRSPEKFVAPLYGILEAIAETIGKNEGLFFTLLIVIIVGIIGAFNPAVGIILAGIAFIFAGFMGFIYVSVTAMILVLLLIIILVVKMGRQGV